MNCKPHHPWFFSLLLIGVVLAAGQGGVRAEASAIGMASTGTSDKPLPSFLFTVTAATEKQKQWFKERSRPNFVVINVDLEQLNALLPMLKTVNSSDEKNGFSFGTYTISLWETEKNSDVILAPAEAAILLTALSKLDLKADAKEMVAAALRRIQ